MDTCSMARDKVAPFARMEISRFVSRVFRQRPNPAAAWPKAAALHAQALPGFEQDLRRPPMLLSRRAFNSRCRL